MNGKRKKKSLSTQKHNHTSNIVRTNHLSAYKKNSVNKVQSICKIKEKKRRKKHNRAFTNNH